MTYEDDVKSGTISEKEYYNSTRLFSKNGLLKNNISNVICCWDFWLSVTLTILSFLTLHLLKYLSQSEVKIPLKDLLTISYPVYVALIVIFVTGITLLYVFDKDSKVASSYMKLIIKGNTYRDLIFIPYWGAAVTVISLIVSIISSLFGKSLHLPDWLLWLALLINLFFLIYVIMLSANFVGTLVRHGIYSARFLREEEQNQQNEMSEDNN